MFELVRLSGVGRGNSTPASDPDSSVHTAALSGWDMQLQSPGDHAAQTQLSRMSKKKDERRGPSLVDSAET